jgi:hypothetical protein
MTLEEDIQFQKVVTEGLVPKLAKSNYAVAVCPTAEDRIDAKFCVELGAMIMLDKPIIAVVDPDVSVPRKLEQVADKIVHADVSTEAGRAVLMEAIQDMNDQLGFE